MAEPAVFDLEGVGNLGMCVLRAATGEVVRSSGDLGTEDGLRISSGLFQLLLDTGSILKDDPLRRITVSYPSHQYVVSISSGFVYMLKRNPT